MAAKHTTDMTENAELYCSVCLEQYRDPRTLTCAHTFCQICIHQHILKQKEDGHLKEGIECSLCRKITPKSAMEIQPEEWSKTLPVNYALQEVIDSQNKEVELCTICERKDIRTCASKYCFQCNKNICDDCEKIHNIFENFENHRIVRIDDKTNLKTIPSELDRCTVHGKPIEFYCIDENKLCCSSCAIIKHRKCNEVAEISDIAEKQNEEIETTMAVTMRELNMKAKNVDYFYDKQEKEMDRQLSQIDEDMSKEQERVLTILKESRAKIIAEATSVREIASEKYEFYRSQCKTLTSSLKGSYESIDVARQYGTPTQLFIALHKQQLQLAEITKSGDTVFNDLKYFDISTESKGYLSYLQDIQRNQCELKSQERKLDINEVPDYRTVNIELVRSVDLKATSEDEEDPIYTGLEFLPDGRFIAVDNNNSKCIIMDEELKSLWKYKSTEMLLDVICISKEDILLSADLSLLVFRVTEDNDFRPKETINIKRNADSLSIYNDDTFVVGTYNSRKPATMLHRNGKEKDFDIIFPDKDWMIDDSFCSFDKASGKLAVSDKSENKVYIYDTNTKTEIVVQDERMKEPRGVAPGPESCFFVCSSKTDAIVQISHTGDILRSYKVDMSDPFALCFSKDKTKFAVSSYGNESKLQLYRISH